MTIEKLNNAFNEALEEISIDENETYSMDFVQHHENALETKLKKLKTAGGFQFIVFLVLFLFIIFNQNGRWIQFPYEVNRYLTLILWGIIMVNSYFATKRGKRMKEIENKLLLISVYKKIMDKENNATE